VVFEIYRGYFIHLGGKSNHWRFVAAPATPDLPILSRAVSRQFATCEAAESEAKRQIDRLLCL
jgi:hypothetical protein